ncbi:MAG: type II toxin-antitoxin system RelE/ParE family toxin [Mobilicoccus sp.]|nr:type II toxin-antitoxin system RelE/ParE family toxin [Mobilicoccus sp.]
MNEPSGDASEPYRVTLSASAARSLRAVPSRIAEPLVTFAFEGLASSPRRRGKPLGADFAGLWGARRGDYRVIYEIDDEARVVAVVSISHRAHAYRPR